MKKSVLSFLILAAFLITACNTPVNSTTGISASEPPSATEVKVVEKTTEGVEEPPQQFKEAAPVEQSMIPVKELMNATYSGIYAEPFTLMDGMFADSIEEQPFTVRYIEDAELFADLDGDGDQDAVVFLLERGGGTAVFTYIAAQLNQNGQPVDAGTAMVEDRTQVRSAAIEEGQIVLNITTRGPGDADCCPSHKTRKTYALEENRLVELPGKEQDLVKISMDDLNGTSWTLIELGEDTPILEDTDVSITFQEGQFNGSGGCNSYNGSFSLGDPNPFIMSIGTITATKIACPDPVLDQEDAYFKALESASLWGYMYGHLVLAYSDDPGEGLKRLLFAPEGITSSADWIKEVNMNTVQHPESTVNKPDYVMQLEAGYGAPSQSGFGSAVFFEQLKGANDLEQAALQKYQHFVGDTWARFGEDAWMGAWKLVYARPAGAERDIVAELQGITDKDASLSVPMILTGIENAEDARKALSSAYDDAAVVELAVYNLGDGEVMYGLLVAGRRSNGETTFLCFLYD